MSSATPEDRKVEETSDGTKYYYKNDKLHRDGDLPAIEFAHGYKFYYKNGLLHREGDLPAIEYANGDKEYYKNGERHREGELPAIEYAGGYEAYYKHGYRFPSFFHLRRCHQILSRLGKRLALRPMIRTMKRMKAIHRRLTCEPPRWNGKFPGGIDYQLAMADYSHRLSTRDGRLFASIINSRLQTIRIDYQLAMADYSH